MNLSIDQSVRIVCPDHERGAVCDGWGFTTRTTVFMLCHVGREAHTAYLRGVPRPFTLRGNGKWVLRGYKADRGPYLK